MSAAAEWMNNVTKALRAFVEERNIEAPTIKVTLTDGEWFFLHSASAMGSELLSLSPYPDEESQFVEGRDGTRLPPRVVVVDPRYVHKVELLAHAPGGGHGFPFQAPGEVTADSTPGA